jgi:hypothetical protein
MPETIRESSDANYVSRAMTFLARHKVRLVAAALIAISIWILYGAGSTGFFPWLLLIGPLLAGAAVPLFSDPAMTGMVNGWQNFFEAGLLNAKSRDTKFARNFLRPLHRYSLAIWKISAHVGDVHVRAGLRLSIVTYFWAFMIVALITAVYLIVAFIILGVVLAIYAWFKGWTPSRPARDRASQLRERSIKTSRFGAANLRVDEEGNIQKGMLGNTIGRIAEDGTIFKKTTLGEDEIGRLDLNGDVYRRTGIFSEEHTGSIDEDGVLDGTVPLDDTEPA